MNKITMFLLALVVAGICQRVQPAAQAKDLFGRVNDVLMQPRQRRSLYQVFKYRDLPTAPKVDVLPEACEQLRGIFADAGLVGAPAPEYTSDDSGKYKLYFWLTSRFDTSEKCYITVGSVDACSQNGQPTGSYKGQIKIAKRIKQPQTLYTKQVDTFLTLKENDNGVVSTEEQTKNSVSLTKAGKACVAIGAATVAALALGLKYKEKIAAVIRGLKKVAVVG